MIENKTTSPSNISAERSGVNREPETIVHAPEIERDGDRTVVTATVEIEGKREEIWYRVAGASVSASSDPFVAVALYPAMKVGAPLLVKGPVSAKLLQNLDQIQDVFHTWYPEFRKIPVRATEVRSPDLERARGVGCFFSAGVDSYFTLLNREEEIDSLIHVLGFDIRIHEEAFCAQMEDKIAETCRLLGKRRILMETNLRDFGDPYADWSLHHSGAGLASVALLLAPEIGKVYNSSSHTYARLFPAGTHFILDPLWSTENLEIAHYGCGTNRIEKIERLTHSPIAMKTLRVCLDRRSGRYNCGRCEKCLRTLVSLKAIGALGQCETMENSIDLKALRRVVIRNDIVLDYAQENLDAMERLGTEPELARILKRQIAQHWIRRLRRKLKELTNHSGNDWTWRDRLWMIAGKMVGRRWKR
jgi:hypothetical protein